MCSYSIRLLAAGGLSRQSNVNGSFRVRTLYGWRSLANALVTKEKSGCAGLGAQRCAPAAGRMGTDGQWRNWPDRRRWADTSNLQGSGR